MNNSGNAVITIRFGVNEIPFKLRLTNSSEKILNQYIDHSRQPHLEIKTRMRIEDDCNPLTITEAMTTDSATEKFLLICNDNAKLRLINAETKMCRKVYGLPQTMFSFKVLMMHVSMYCVYYNCHNDN